MVWQRFWHQEVFLLEGDGFLDLEHPDGRNGCFRFNSDMINQVSLESWNVEKHGSARYTTKEFEVMHLQWLMRPDLLHNQTQQVGFINGDHSDCRRENLFQTTRRQLAWQRPTSNKLSIPGVTLRTRSKSDPGSANRTNSYAVRIRFGGQRIHMPCFKTLDQAAMCSDVFVKIAIDYDNGTRELPTQAELMKIASRCRGE